MSEANAVLAQLRALQRDLDAAASSDQPYNPVLIQEFTDLFRTLDSMLRDGGQFPREWITKDNQTRESYMKPPTAGCGHPQATSNSIKWCLNEKCINYYFGAH